MASIPYLQASSLPTLPGTLDTIYYLYLLELVVLSLAVLLLRLCGVVRGEENLHHPTHLVRDDEPANQGQARLAGDILAPGSHPIVSHG